MTKFSTLALAGVALLGFAAHAAADSLDRPGSLLVYPWYDNTRGGFFGITVTNTNSDQTPAGGSSTLLTGTVDVEFVYIDGNTCLEFNRTRRLTPNDTITVASRFDNPNSTQGYVYVFAKSPTSGAAIAWDYLAGDSFVVNPAVIGAVELPPIVFKAGAGLAAGAHTDVDNDGRRDLNGTEYEQVSDELLVPRFIADDGAINSRPQLILIGLTGQSFSTIINFLIYNDNEEVFSAQYQFDCWDRVNLVDITGVFDNSFLLSTNHAVNESVLGTTVSNGLETGWFRMDGSIAFSTAASVQDPAFLAARIERLAAGIVSVASLPYGVGEQNNGDLVTHGPFPDTN
jgi:hypothetical protein